MEIYTNKEIGKIYERDLLMQEGDTLLACDDRVEVLRLAVKSYSNALWLDDDWLPAYFKRAKAYKAIADCGGKERQRFLNAAKSDLDIIIARMTLDKTGFTGLDKVKKMRGELEQIN